MLTTHTGLLGQEVEINTETVPTPVFLILIIHYPACSHPPLLCSSPWELLMSQNEGWRGSTGKLGERREEGKVGGSTKKSEDEDKEEKGEKSKDEEQRGSALIPRPMTHSRQLWTMIAVQEECKNLLQIGDYYSVCSLYIDSVLVTLPSTP